MDPAKLIPGSGETAFRHTSHLSAGLGPRPSATPANLAAAEYIRQELTTLGYQIETQPFDAVAWQENAVSLKARGTSYPASASTFSPSCRVNARLVPACSLAELKAADLTGKIALLYGDLTKDPISPKAWFLISDWEKEILACLESKCPAALITVQARPGELERIIEDFEFKIPSVVVSAQIGRELLQLPESTSLHLEIDASLKPGQTLISSPANPASKPNGWLSWLISIPNRIRPAPLITLPGLESCSLWQSDLRSATFATALSWSPLPMRSCFRLGMRNIFGGARPIFLRLLLP